MPIWPKLETWDHTMTIAYRGTKALIPPVPFQFILPCSEPPFFQSKVRKNILMDPRGTHQCWGQQKRKAASWHDPTKCSPRTTSREGVGARNQSRNTWFFSCFHINYLLLNFMILLHFFPLLSHPDGSVSHHYSCLQLPSVSNLHSQPHH